MGTLLSMTHDHVEQLVQHACSRVIAAGKDFMLLEAPDWHHYVYAHHALRTHGYRTQFVSHKRSDLGTLLMVQLT